MPAAHLEGLDLVTGEMQCELFLRQAARRLEVDSCAYRGAGGAPAKRTVGLSLVRPLGNRTRITRKSSVVVLRAPHNRCANTTRELDGASTGNSHQPSCQSRLDTVEPRLSDTYREAFD